MATAASDLPSLSRLTGLLSKLADTNLSIPSPRLSLGRLRDAWIDIASVFADVHGEVAKLADGHGAAATTFAWDRDQVIEALTDGLISEIDNALTVDPAEHELTEADRAYEMSKEPAL